MRVSLAAVVTAAMLSLVSSQYHQAGLEGQRPRRSADRKLEEAPVKVRYSCPKSKKPVEVTFADANPYFPLGIYPNTVKNNLLWDNAVPLTLTPTEICGYAAPYKAGTKKVAFNNNGVSFSVQAISPGCEWKPSKIKMNSA